MDAVAYKFDRAADGLLDTGEAWCYLNKSGVWFRKKIMKIKTIVVFALSVVLPSAANPCRGLVTRSIWNTLGDLTHIARRLGVRLDPSAGDYKSSFIKAVKNLEVERDDERDKWELLRFLNAEWEQYSWSSIYWDGQKRRLVRLVHRYTEIGDSGVFPFARVLRSNTEVVFLGLREEETLGLYTIADPSIVALARNIPWYERDELLSLLRTEIPAAQFELPLERVFDKYSTESLGLAVLTLRLRTLPDCDKSLVCKLGGALLRSMGHHSKNFFEPKNRNKRELFASTFIFGTTDIASMDPKEAALYLRRIFGEEPVSVRYVIRFTV